MRASLPGKQPRLWKSTPPVCNTDCGLDTEVFSCKPRRTNHHHWTGTTGLNLTWIHFTLTWDTAEHDGVVGAATDTNTAAADGDSMEDGMNGKSCDGGTTPNSPGWASRKIWYCSGFNKHADMRTPGCSRRLRPVNKLRGIRSQRPLQEGAVKNEAVEYFTGCVWSNCTTTVLRSREQQQSESDPTAQSQSGSEKCWTGQSVKTISSKSETSFRFLFLLIRLVLVSHR